MMRHVEELGNCLKTSDLQLEINVDSEFVFGENKLDLTAHILTCVSENVENQIAFIRLCESFKDAELTQATDVIRLFNAFVELFGNAKKCSYIELQGLFAELFTMKFFENKCLNLYQYWQSKDKCKHDFYISSKKE